MSVYGNNAPVLVSAFDDLYTPKIITTGRRPSDSFIRAVGNHMIHPRERVQDAIPLSIRNKEAKLARVTEKEIKKEVEDKERAAFEEKNEWKSMTRVTALPSFRKMTESEINKLDPDTIRFYTQKLALKKVYLKSSAKYDDYKNAYMQTFK